jgi:hypothetical protein
MSHFTVLVVGPNVNSQLAPYDEDGGDREGKWDWFVVGGRWAGYFKVKQGVKIKPFEDRYEVDQAVKRGVAYVNGESDTFSTKAEPGFADVIYKGDIDVESMRAASVADAERLYDAAAKVLKGLDRSAFRTWEETYRTAEKKEGDKRVNIDEARVAYQEQPHLKALSDAKLSESWGTGHELLIVMSRTDYVEKARLNAIMSHAYLKDGEWVENAEMGWFGTQGEAKNDPLAWGRQFNEMFDALPDDTLITVVDCHV